MHASIGNKTLPTRLGEADKIMARWGMSLNRPPPSSAYTVFGLQTEAEPIAAGLHVVATPIGNLRDISLRALATLSAADLILAEDTRVTRVLLAHYGITTPLWAYHEHNAAEMRPKVMYNRKRFYEFVDEQEHKINNLFT